MSKPILITLDVKLGRRGCEVGHAATDAMLDWSCTVMLTVCLCCAQRNIHSSPAAFTIDRVVQCFRARSALLVSRLEDDDEVLHKTFSDCDDKDDAGDEQASDQSNNEYIPNY